MLTLILCMNLNSSLVASTASHLMYHGTFIHTYIHICIYIFIYIYIYHCFWGVQLLHLGTCPILCEVYNQQPLNLELGIVDKIFIQVHFTIAHRNVWTIKISSSSFWALEISLLPLRQICLHHLVVVCGHADFTHDVWS